MNTTRKVCMDENCPNTAMKDGLCRTHYARANAPSSCKVDGCDGYPFTKGLCNKHYQRIWKGIPLDFKREYINKGKLCSEHGCERKAYSRGLCWSHYKKYLVKIRKKKHQQLQAEIE